MNNSNNDRWSSLATDLGVEVSNDKDSTVEIQNDTSTTANNNVSRNALMVIPEVDTAKLPEIEFPPNTTSPLPFPPDTTSQLPLPPNQSSQLSQASQSSQLNQSSQSSQSDQLNQASQLPQPATSKTPQSTTKYNGSNNRQFSTYNKKSFVSTPIKTSSNLSDNNVKSSVPKYTNSSSPTRKSSFGAGILEQEEITSENNVTKNINSETSETHQISSHNLSSSENIENISTAAVSEKSEINVAQNQTYNSINSQLSESIVSESESSKSEPVKRSFFGRLQQINIFGTRNKNNNTTKPADDNNIKQDEYKDNGLENINGDIQSEREHLPHGRYLPPHAQSLYKSHTQSHPTLPPPQHSQQPPPTRSPQQPHSTHSTHSTRPHSNQSNQTSNTGRDVFDPLRQIATQISKLGGKSVKRTVNNNESKGNHTVNNQGNRNRSGDSHYKKSHQNYRYNNSTNGQPTDQSTNRPAGYYPAARTNLTESPETLFEDDLPETEEVIALRQLMSDDAAMDEEQRRLASILGDPREEPSGLTNANDLRINSQTSEDSIPSYQSTEPINRYSSNRHQIKPDINTRAENISAGSTDKKWLPPPQSNNSADKSNTFVRGRRGSRFIGKGNGMKSEGTNRTNTLPNSKLPQSRYQSRQTITDKQLGQMDDNNDQLLEHNSRSLGTPPDCNNRQERNWRGGRRYQDNKNNSEIQNDIRYNNSSYSLLQQSQQQYSDYSSVTPQEIIDEDADYIDEYGGGDGIVSDEERLSFAQAHKNIPSWNDAIELIVETNIQRHSRYSQNGLKRR
ncbi:MAG: hypothetical protein LBE18_08445 [Planctomycetaceae bacterium]|jgi:hypothetical protein|nr:hypothetical protein [Planctomycetaceae bacterium]